MKVIFPCKTAWIFSALSPEFELVSKHLCIDSISRPRGRVAKIIESGNMINCIGETKLLFQIEFNRILEYPKDPGKLKPPMATLK